MPTILLFHTGKPVLKFNSSVSLDDMRTFIKNNTGMTFMFLNNIVHYYLTFVNLYCQ